MRYGIFSDVHSNLEALQEVIEVYKKEDIDRYLCVGDVVGYAANPKECIEKVKTLAMITIAGNHDWASTDLFSTEYFNPAASKAISWTKRNLSGQDRYFLESLKLIYENEDLTLAHGRLDSPQDFGYMLDGCAAVKTFALMQTQFCFIGHSHVPGIFIQDFKRHIYYQQDYSMDIKDGFKYIVNAGSVGQPRDGNPKAAYCIYDTDKKEVQIKRISYDIKKARKKILEAGLPQFLGERLLLGK